MSRALSLRTALFAGLAAAGLIVSAAPALAQVSGCAQGQKYLQTHQTLSEKLNNLKDKNNKIDPVAACGLLSKLDNNADSMLKWMNTNKDWCQVPDQLIQNLKEGQTNLAKAKGQACKVAAQVREMQKKAKQQAQQQKGNPFGGGLTGDYKIPQGAL
jgi:hypothetical protein